MINMAWLICEAGLHAELSLVCYIGLSKEDWILPPGVLSPRFKESNTCKERPNQTNKQKRKTETNNKQNEQIETSLKSVIMNVLFSFPSGPPRNTSEGEPSVIQQLFIEDLLYARHCAR